MPSDQNGTEITDTANGSDAVTDINRSLNLNGSAGRFLGKEVCADGNAYMGVPQWCSTICTSGWPINKVIKFVSISHVWGPTVESVELDHRASLVNANGVGMWIDILCTDQKATTGFDAPSQQVSPRRFIYRWADACYEYLGDEDASVFLEDIRVQLRQMKQKLRWKNGQMQVSRHPLVYPRRERGTHTLRPAQWPQTRCQDADGYVLCGVDAAAKARRGPGAVAKKRRLSTAAAWPASCLRCSRAGPPPVSCATSSLAFVAVFALIIAMAFGLFSLSAFPYLCGDPFDCPIIFCQMIETKHSVLAIAGSLLGSSCCVIQLALNAFSIGCSGFSALDPFREIFTALTVGLLTLSLWQNSFRVTWKYIRTVAISLLLLLSPHIVRMYNVSWQPDSAGESAEMQRFNPQCDLLWVWRIDGLKCEGCAARLKTRLSKQFESVAMMVQVDFEGREIRLCTKSFADLTQAQNDLFGVRLQDFEKTVREVVAATDFSYRLEFLGTTTKQQ
ncbi:hypothetical protein HK100_002502 [Physocladia obscura]|uniref:HMA domain-containing protein n=1 Tax=Physocladia obscura TaxID=109957 RepID=A0AAD5SVA7_9FUNG|nr:hypothetical protein HK100_002502 [Physocladia obscura]